jgi:transcriptional regulator with XRE-family HTH domain
LCCICNSNAISELVPNIPNNLELFLKLFFTGMDAIVSQLIAKRSKLGISVPKLAKALDIPADRIYKWEQGQGNPKGGDIIKVNEWLEDIPNSSMNENLPLERAIQNLTEADLINAKNIERLINLLEFKMTGISLPTPGQEGTIPIEGKKKANN